MVPQLTCSYTTRWDSTDEIGTSPKRWLLRARLDRARELLETTDLSVEAVAHRTGHSSSAALRGRFTTALGTSPTEYRGAFRPRRPRPTEQGTGAGEPQILTS
ncbi:MAG: helix-turn-helix domain-containing protein [Acidimicrobiales bacterium]